MIGDGSRSRFDFDPTGQSHKFAVRGCDRGVCVTGRQIKDVHDRASNVLLP